MLSLFKLMRTVWVFVRIPNFIRGGPLKKCWRVGLLHLAGIIFSRPLPLQDIFWGFKSPARFFLGEGGGWGIFYCHVAILILTLATVWLPGTGFKQITVIFHTVVLLYCQNYTPGDTTKYHTFKRCLTDGAALLLSLMFREISISFIHSPCDKIHSWHAVNQGFR